MARIVRLPKLFGAAIRERRREMKLTQADLAGKSGLRRPTISTVEGGDPGTKLQTIFSILAALDLDLVVQPRTKGSHSDIEKIF